MITQDVMFQKLCYIVHRSLVEIRNSALTGDRQKLFELGDAFEILPSLMSRWQDENAELVREILTDFQKKYGATSFDFLSVLDMDDDEFLKIYGHEGGYR